jgi:hypothetical protein
MPASGASGLIRETIPPRLASYMCTSDVCWPRRRPGTLCTAQGAGVPRSRMSARPSLKAGEWPSAATASWPPIGGIRFPPTCAELSTTVHFEAVLRARLAEREPVQRQALIEAVVAGGVELNSWTPDHRGMSREQGGVQPRLLSAIRVSVRVRSGFSSGPGKQGARRQGPQWGHLSI